MSQFYIKINDYLINGLFDKKNENRTVKNDVSCGRFFQPLMYIILVSLVIGLFVAMLFLNLYFRVKVFKVYKKLVQNRVQFEPSHVFNKEKMESEVYPKYPNHVEDIETFVNNMQRSIKMASVLAALITLFGAILMYYR